MPQMSPLGWVIFPFVMVAMMVLVLMVFHDLKFCKEVKGVGVSGNVEKEW